MFTRPVTSDQLRQLRDERDAADLAYNAALTSVDAALVGAANVSGPPPPYDEQILPAINDSWEIFRDAGPPPPRGIRSRLAHLVWRLVAPVFERQQTFNARLVDHLNRNVPTERAVVDGLARLADAVRDHTSALAALQSHLIAYFQQFTLYVDTKDRLDAADLMAAYDGAINALVEEQLLRNEVMEAREARFHGRLAAVTAAHDELNGSLAVLQQATMTFRRELAAFAAGAATAPKERTLQPDQPVQPGQPGQPVPSLDSYKYLAFEDRFRGSRDDIRERIRPYVALFAGRHDVLDVGCGRGEFLDLLREAGIASRGLDMNHEMVEVCRERGLEVYEGDMVGYLESLADGSLGGLIAVQVVEHLEPG
jgi:hypothetical protein